MLDKLFRKLGFHHEIYSIMANASDSSKFAKLQDFIKNKNNDELNSILEVNEILDEFIDQAPWC